MPNMSKRLARLLPAEDGSGPSPFDPPRDDHLKRKRVGTDIACNACRRRKTRCDGLRPHCAACRKRSTECEYVEKRDGKSSQSPECSGELVDLLRSAPEGRALKILQLLRSSDDLASVLSFAKGAVDGAVGLSDETFTNGTRPAQSPLEVELMVKNPVAYPPLQTLPLSSLQRDGLLQPTTQRRSKSFDLQIGPGPTLPKDDSTPFRPAPGLPRPPDSSFRLTGIPEERRKPKRTLCDSRLKHLRIGFWTDIPIPDDYAARVISLYLTTDHPLLGIFDPDLFISDLIRHQYTFCSRLLVHSLMYWACQMYTTVDAEAIDLAEAFCKEAENLWAWEQHNDTLQNAASAQLLSLAYLGHGKDHHVLKYLSAALRMGTRMSLFGVSPPEASAMVQDMSLEMQRASSYTAWGVFNWAVLMTLFYQQPGLEYPDHPPTLPMPGTPLPLSAYNRSRSLSSESSDEPPPAYMGHTFPTLCKFWHVIHDVTMSYHKNRQASLPEHVSLEFAEFKYRELLAWIEGIPSDQVLKEHCPHHVLIFHIWFHAAILDIFRPFLQHDKSKRLHLRTFSTRRCTPDDAFNASVNQLKQLVIRYRCNYESSAYTLLWQSALIYVANAVLHETQDPDWKFYFLACIYGYEGLRKSYRLAEVISQGLLTMTLRGGDITGNEARGLLRQVQDSNGDHIHGDIRATFMVDLDLAMRDPEAASVENMASRFEDVALFRDFTTVDDEEAQSFQAMDETTDLS